MFIHASRRTIGMVLGLIAAVAAVWSVFISWYAGREGSNIRIQDLFNSSITLNNAGTFTSLFLPLAFAALLFVVFAVIGWRWLLVVGGLISIATVLLWGTRQAQTATGLHSTLVGHGPQLAAAAGAVMLIAAAVAPPRRHRDRLVPRETAGMRDRPVAREAEGGTTAGISSEGAYTAGYSDAQAATDSEAEELAGHRSGTARQQPQPPDQHDDPGR